MTFNYKALKRLIDEKGIKASQLSDMTAIPRNTIGYYLKGETTPKLERIQQIAETLGVSPETFYVDDADEIAAPYEKLILSVAEAARMMGCSEQRIRQGIINDNWNPSIGSAIREKGPREKYQFHIPLRRVQSYLMILPEQCGVAGDK